MDIIAYRYRIEENEVSDEIEAMDRNLEYLAKNLSEWPKTEYPNSELVTYRRNRGGYEICFCEPGSTAYKVNKTFTFEQWLQARKDLGLIMTESEEELPAEDWAGKITDTPEEAAMVEDMVEVHEALNPKDFGAISGIGRIGGKRTAENFLLQAADLMAERGKQYDQPGGERSMGKAVAALNAITGRDLTESEGWLLMSLVKRVRQHSGSGYHQDSAEDAVAYAALEAEALEGSSDGF